MIPQIEELAKEIAAMKIADDDRERLVNLCREAEKQVKGYEFRLDRATKDKSAMNTLIQGIKEDYEQEQEKLNVAIRAKSDFLARMSHEIRTPMNAIIGLSHLTLRTALSARQEDYVGKILSSSQSLLGIINDILDFSKIEAGKLSLECLPFRLDEELDNVVNQVALRASEKNLEFLLSLAPGTPLVLMGDPLRLRQILLNLATNAIKFTQAGEVVIAVSAEDQVPRSSVDGTFVLRFSVRDTGIGLNPGQRARLFQSFSQADGSTTRKYGGTGLGLVICQRLAQMMGGDIGVESEEGKGSTFWFTVRCGLPAVPATGLALEPLPQSLLGLRALVVDDNAAAREVLRQALGYFGWRADSVESGEEALRALEERPEVPGYDLVLLDWMMPGLDGFATAEAIRARRSASMPKLLLVRAFGHDERSRDGKVTCFDGYLAKPIGLMALLNAVREAFGLEIVRRASRDTLADMHPEGFETIRGARILLVEDNEINQQIALEILSFEGFWVTVAGDGIEAVRTLAESPGSFDLVLMDLQMPRMDGFMATREIRRLGFTLPIVAMTADAVSGVEAKCRKAGMDEFVTKPIDPRELFLALVHWIEPGKRTVYSEPQSAMDPEASLPELPGFELSSALARFGGRVDSYRKLLVRFSRFHVHDAVEIREALGRGDRVVALRMAHTLKGVSGNIGATELYGKSLELESAIKSGRNELEPLLQDMERELDRSLAVLQCLSSEEDSSACFQEEASEGMVGAGTGSVAPLLAILRTQLLENEVDAAATCAELKVRLRGTESSALIRLIGDALDDYDFDMASGLLAKLKV